MKIHLEYDPNNPEDIKTINRIIKANDCINLINDIEDNLFRPYHKHGYPQHTVLNNEIHNPAIEELEEMFYQLKEQYDIHPLTLL